MKYNLLGASHTDLIEIHTFLHAAKIAAMVDQSISDGSPSIATTITALKSAVAEEIERRGIPMPDRTVGERVYTHGCHMIDAMVPA